MQQLDFSISHLAAKCYEKQYLFIGSLRFSFPIVDEDSAGMKLSISFSFGHFIAPLVLPNAKSFLGYYIQSFEMFV